MHRFAEMTSSVDIKATFSTAQNVPRLAAPRRRTGSIIPYRQLPRRDTNATCRRTGPRVSIRYRSYLFQWHFISLCDVTFFFFEFITFFLSTDQPFCISITDTEELTSKTFHSLAVTRSCVWPYMVGRASRYRYRQLSPVTPRAALQYILIVLAFSLTLMR
jgi:hypothetical protein